MTVFFGRRRQYVLLTAMDSDDEAYILLLLADGNLPTGIEHYPHRRVR